MRNWVSCGGMASHYATIFYLKVGKVKVNYCQADKNSMVPLRMLGGCDVLERETHMENITKKQSAGLINRRTRKYVRRDLAF
jgi:hypothetical protein